MGNAEVIKNIYRINLAVKKTERVLVLTDIMREEEKAPESDAARRADLVKIAKEVADAGKEFCEASYLEFPSVMGHGKEPPVPVWEAAFGKSAVDILRENNVLDPIMSKTAGEKELKEAEAVIAGCAKSPEAIIALTNFSTSHTRFRDFLTRLKGVRYASMPLFERSMLAGAMTADWNRVAERTGNLVKMVSGGDSVSVKSPNGTSICFSIKDRAVKGDTGLINKPGAFSNLPAGEAFLAPLEGTAEGVLVLDWAPTKKLKDPIRIEVKGGTAVNVIGKDDFAQSLREKLKANPLIGNIAELGIGTNDKATRPDNILETEKILGTVHIALGDNSSFGGKVSVPFHQDFIFFNPTLEVFKDGKKVEVITEGKVRF